MNNENFKKFLDRKLGSKDFFLPSRMDKEAKQIITKKIVIPALRKSFSKIKNEKLRKKLEESWALYKWLIFSETAKPQKVKSEDSISIVSSEITKALDCSDVVKRLMNALLAKGLVEEHIKIECLIEVYGMTPETIGILIKKCLEQKILSPEDLK